MFHFLIEKKDCGHAKIPLDKVFARGLLLHSERYGRLVEPAAAELALGGLTARLSGKGSAACSRFELRENARSTMPSNIGISESEGTVG